MKCELTELEGVVIFEPRVFGDERGAFFESFNQEQFDQEVGGKTTFVQDNQSISQKGVLRGLHFQNPPFAQGKLVRVIKGSVIDVAVDIRKNSSAYGQHVAVELSEKNHRQLWIPPGFAHGFVALEDDTIFAYKCTNYYAPKSEGCIKWDDRLLNIQWGIKSPIVSEKDQLGDDFNTFATAF